MFHCDWDFQRHTDTIRRIWKGFFNTTIGNWQDGWWWGGLPVFLGLMLGAPLIAIDSENLYKNSQISPLPYLRQRYCPQVGDCITFLHWPLPAWYWFHLILAFVVLLSGLVTQWGYRRKRWCLAWWAYLSYIFSAHFFFSTIAESGLFVGLSGSPIPTALVGYGVPVIYTIWFLGALLPPMRRLWRREHPGFRPSPLKLQAGAGGAAALLGILGVALGRLLGETPHGDWGYFAVGVIGVPWMMFLAIRGGKQTLLTLAPWRIVLEAEAAKEVLGEGFEEETP